MVAQIRFIVGIQNLRNVANIIQIVPKRFVIIIIQHQFAKVFQIVNLLIIANIHIQDVNTI